MKDVDTLVRDHLHREAERARLPVRRWEERIAWRRRGARMPDVRTLGTAVAAVILAAGLAVPLIVVSALRDDRSGRPGQSLPSTPAHERHVDIDDGLAITIPHAWTFHQDPTEPIEPKNVFGVGSWAFPGGGDCAPTAAQDHLPKDGVLFWLIEFTGDQPASDFPPRPERFELDRQTLGVYECSTVPSYVIRFREAVRFFQVHVAFGPDASDSLEPEVLGALDSLEVTAPIPEGCPADTGPWADPDCPWSAWTREVVGWAGQRVTGDTGSALRAAVDGIGYFIWTTESGPPPGGEGYEPSFRLDETTVYTDGVRIAWQAQGFTIWVEVDVGGPVPREAIEDLVRASLEVDYDTIDTR
jgi:hypothetical protein